MNNNKYWIIKHNYKGNRITERVRAREVLDALTHVRRNSPGTKVETVDREV